MTVLRRRPGLRWLVPLLAVVLLAAGGSLAGMLTAAARSGLPHRSASTLLVDVQKARLDGLSGTIVQNADLGLPSLPGVSGSGSGGGSSDLTSLVSGSHTLRLWYAGPDRVRLALLGSLGESDVVRSGTHLWTWSSKDHTATHRSVPAASGDEPRSLAAASPLTPQQAADAALKAITPTTKVSTDGTAVVAGRSAYELLLRPRTTGSLVQSVRIAIDGKTHIPLRVQVFATSTGKPAFEVGFTAFDPTTPPSSVFGFNPPPGTKVTRAKALSPRAFAAHGAGDRVAKRTAAAARKQEPRVVGTGWTSVAIVPVPSKAGSGRSSMAQALTMLPKVSGTWGSGHLLRGTLFSALLTDDGRLVVGAVPPQRLFRTLAR